MDGTLSFSALVALIFVALAFDFLNGLHDAANSIATVVSTRVLRPQYAVIWAAFFNFIAFLFFGLHVAQTVGTGIVAAEVIDAAVIFGALMGAICWNLLTWWLGLPSSSSHALMGGLCGAGTKKNVQLNGATFAVSGGIPAGVPAAICGSHVCHSRSSSERPDMISAGPNCSTWSPCVVDTTRGGRPIASRYGALNSRMSTAM